MSGVELVSNAFGDYEVRHAIQGGEPIWIGRDVCEAIGIAKYRDALAQLDADERVSIVMDTPGGPQKMTAVTEAGIWSLMLISRSPHVKTFKRWLTHHVLPEIRRTGAYRGEQAAVAAMPTHAEALRGWAAELERAEAAEAQVRELTPAASAWQELADAQGDYAVADAAKVLSRDAQINTGERRLFSFMSAERWIFKRDGRWRAYQSQVDCGRLVEKVGRPYVRDGVMHNGEPTVRITPKGLAELHKRLGGSGQLELMAVVS